MRVLLSSASMKLPVEVHAAPQCTAGVQTEMESLSGRFRPLPGVEHYGVFSGRRWESSIFAIVREVIHSAQ